MQKTKGSKHGNQKRPSVSQKALSLLAHWSEQHTAIELIIRDSSPIRSYSGVLYKLDSIDGFGFSSPCGIHAKLVPSAWTRASLDEVQPERVINIRDRKQSFSLAAMWKQPATDLKPVQEQLENWYKSKSKLSIRIFLPFGAISFTGVVKQVSDLCIMKTGAPGSAVAIPLARMFCEIRARNGQAVVSMTSLSTGNQVIVSETETADVDVFKAFQVINGGLASGKVSHRRHQKPISKLVMVPES